MNKINFNQRGFTLIEILITLVILLVIGTIGVTVFVKAKQNKELDLAFQTVIFNLNTAKADAITGKGGQDFGIKFNSDSYVYFVGSSYNPSSSSNKTYSLPNNINASSSFSGSSQIIVFKRMSGTTNNSGMIDIFRVSEPSILRSVTIGAQGDFNVVK